MYSDLHFSCFWTNCFGIEPPNSLNTANYSGYPVESVTNVICEHADNKQASDEMHLSLLSSFKLFYFGNNVRKRQELDLQE